MSLQLLFAERLKAARQQAGISQKQLGILIGIDEFSASPRMNQYERGKHLPDLETAKRLAETLSVPMCYFYCPEDVMANLLLLIHKMTEAEKNNLVQQLSGTTK